MLLDWQLMRHVHAGERAVKDAELTYLPATPGHRLDGMAVGAEGRASYDAYKTRAIFPGYVTEAVKSLIGIMHHNPPTIELPVVMEPLRDKGTVNGESLELLLRRINEQQLIAGRVGILADLQDGSPLPYIATYEAETIINWDNGQIDDPTLQSLNLVVLDESEYERVNVFEWVQKTKHRVLILGEVETNEESGVYQQALFEGAEVDFNPDAMIEPEIRANKLEQIPFVFINSTDLLPDPLKPPLLELGNLCLAIYRGEADYRQNLYLQAQDTFVIIGGNDDKTYRLGAGAAINLPLNGDAKFVGVNSSGLPEQRQSLENDKARAAQLSGQLIDTTSRAKESGEALRIRVAAQTASLPRIAMAGAEGLQTLLRIIAVWVGADPDEVVVTPNLDFAEIGLTIADILQLTQAKAAGAPITDEDLHAILVENDLSQTDYATAVAKLTEEKRQAAATDYLQVGKLPIMPANQPPTVIQ